MATLKTIEFDTPPEVSADSKARFQKKKKIVEFSNKGLTPPPPLVEKK